MFSILPPFYSSSSSMTLAMRLPSSQSKSKSSVFVKFWIGLHGKVPKVEALIRVGASGKRLWNSSTYSWEFFKFSSGSQVSSRGKNPLQLTRYSNLGLPRPRFIHRLSSILSWIGLDYIYFFILSFLLYIIQPLFTRRVVTNIMWPALPHHMPSTATKSCDSHSHNPQTFTITHNKYKWSVRSIVVYKG